MGIPPASPIAASVRGPRVYRVSVEQAKAAPGMHGPGCVGCSSVHVCQKACPCRQAQLLFPGGQQLGHLALWVAPSPDSDSGPLGTEKAGFQPRGRCGGAVGFLPPPVHLAREG